MKKFGIISTAACTLVLVSQLHFVCSDIRRVPPTAAATPRLSGPSSTRPTSHSTGGVVRFPTLQAKAYAIALADLLRTIASSKEFREGSSTLHQLLTVLRPLFRAVGIVPPPAHKIEDTTTTTTMTTTTSTTTTAPTTQSSPQTIITCPPTDKGSSKKKLMALFVPMSAAPSSPTESPLSTFTLPKLFRKADSYIANR